MGKQISVVLNTYNAEKYLDEVLKSVSCFDEIVVCDMESVDGTLSIAKKYGCKIVTFPKGNNKICEPARDFAIRSATFDWVLVVDADEIIPMALRDYLYNRINEPGFDSALAIPRRNMFMGRPTTALPDYQLRFFLKDRTKWQPVIHSRPEIDGRIENVPVRKDLYIIHLDNPTISERLDKLNRYSDYEVSKRRGRTYGITSLLFKPAWFFFRDYVIGRGFRDGWRGLVRAYLSMIYQVVFLAKIKECESTVSNEKLSIKNEC